MRLKVNSTAAIVLVALVAIGIFYFAVASVIEHAFSTIETNDTYQNADRAVAALNSRVAELENKTTDWSSWDDTYKFVENHNQAYITSNLPPDGSALTSLGIQLALFYNQSNNLVFAQSLDPTTGNVNTAPASVTTAFSPTSRLLDSTVTSESKGLIVLPQGTLQFVAQPILTSESAGPVHGTLVFAQWLTSDEIAQLASLTKLNVSYVPITGGVPARLTQALGTHPRVGATGLTRVSAKEILGYEVMADVYGNPALVAQVDTPRTVHDVASAALTRFNIVILIDTGLALIGCFILLHMIRSRDRTIALKNEFFSIASHELRTPLTVIRDYAQLMKFQFSKRIDDPKFDHMADNIDQTGAQLVGLVNVFLDAARMEQGRIPFEVKPFALQPLLAAIQPEVAATAQKKGITFTVDCPPDLPQAMGDEARVRQVILNCIGNAMKFTDTGGITVKAEVNGKFVKVYISDTGRGMDEAQSKALFQRFAQLRTSDAHIGSGLGLFISKKLIEQMGGHIGVESSAPGIGTSIGFSLPQPPPQSANKSAAPAQTPAPSATPAAGTATVLQSVPAATPTVKSTPQPPTKS